MSTYVKQLYSHLGVHPQIIARPHVTAQQLTFLNYISDDNSG